MKRTSAIAATLLSICSAAFAQCPKIIVIAPDFNEQVLGIEYRGKDVSYASATIAQAVADRYENAKVMSAAEYQVLSATCSPEQLIKLRVASYSLEPKFKTARYALLNIEETFYSAPDLKQLTKTVNQEITGPKWFGVNLPLKWAVRYFVRETAKETTAAK